MWCDAAVSKKRFQSETNCEHSFLAAAYCLLTERAWFVVASVVAVHTLTRLAGEREFEPEAELAAAADMLTWA